MILEENNELMNIITTLQHPIIKEKRKQDGQLIADTAKEILENFPKDTEKLADEFADAIILWGQFIPKFWSKVQKHRKFKMQRLEEKINKKLEQKV
jgi:hypothetical protein